MYQVELKNCGGLLEGAANVVLTAILFLSVEIFYMSVSPYSHASHS